MGRRAYLWLIAEWLLGTHAAGRWKLVEDVDLRDPRLLLVYSCDSQRFQQLPHCFGTFIGFLAHHGFDEVRKLDGNVVVDNQGRRNASRDMLLEQFIGILPRKRDFPSDRLVEYAAQ